MSIAQADPTAVQLIDTLNRELLNGGMSAGMRTDIMAALQAVPSSNALKRARTALYLVATSPQFQVQR